jgi:LmbE family N-acetylglucosaminyl deacetylase
MKFHQTVAGIFVPDGLPEDQALARTTSLGIGAHQDDLEFMCLHAILQCYQSSKDWFTGVTVTDGRGSSRAHEYANYTDEQMCSVRRHEQNKAAFVGEYAAVVHLDYPSAAIKKPNPSNLTEDFKQILLATKPQQVFTHNLADKHDTHLAVVVPLIQAIRELPPENRPRKLYGCEVWRNLDWMVDDDKTVFDVSARENVSAALMGIFDSQISGGKRYDLATLGRKRANATYFASHATDQARLLEFAMDLTPLILQTNLNLADFVVAHIQKFSEDVRTRIAKFSTKTN